jgi:phosphopantetheinyl transferase
VTIAHAADAAAALAGVDAKTAGGIDIEPVGELSPVVRRAVFTPGEAALIDELPEAEGWPMRLWCAKEAAGKASGRGLDGNPQSIEVLEVDSASGVASVALPDGERLSVRTAIERGLAYAACVKQTESEVRT